MKRFLLGWCVLMSSLVCGAYNTQKIVNGCDLRWQDDITDSFYEGAFLGDGLQGVMVLADTVDTTAIRMQLGHYRAIAHHVIRGWEFCDSRVLAGNIILRPRGSLIHRTMHMDIWNGEVSGEMVTSLGRISWQLISDRQNKVFLVQVRGTGGEKGAQAEVREEWGITPRFYLEPQRRTQDYADELPPRPTTVSDADGHRLVQNPMHDRGAHVVASARKGNTLFVSIGTSDATDIPQAVREASADATQRLDRSMALGFKAVRNASRTFWHDYYTSCTLSLPSSPRWEHFWWLQMYKFACCTDAQSDNIIDTQGPWVTASAWAAIWYNLNVQLSYMPMYTSLATLREGHSLVAGIDRYYRSGALRRNTGGHGIGVGRAGTYTGDAPYISEFGNLPWLLQCCYKYWQYTGQCDPKLLFQQMRESLEYLETQMTAGQDGRLEFVSSISPEYFEGNNDRFVNVNYALMSTQWLLKTLIRMDRELNMNSGEVARWTALQQRLTPFHTDGNGLRIGRDQPFSTGHRHYSHLLAVYPYHLISPDREDERRLIQTSVDHWQKLTRASGHAGYTFTGGAAMYATLGQGDKALETLDQLDVHHNITRNTMYREGGGQVVETPLSGVESINYMLLQSWGGVIRIFPALPSAWQEAGFTDMLAEGGFQVTAHYDHGRITASIRSLRGGECRLLSPFGQSLTVRDKKGRKIKTTPLTENGQAVKAYYHGQDAEIYCFPTVAGMEYHLGDSSLPN